MNNTKLFLVEGLCGSGKSTLSKRLHGHLSARSHPIFFYDEGAQDHPASLNGHAYLSKTEYLGLIKRNPREAQGLKSIATCEGESVLVPYRGFETGSKPLFDQLKAAELCWTTTPRAPLAEFSGAIQRHWKRFAQSVESADAVYILEGVFMQHQVHDLLRLYQGTDAQIAAHMVGIVLEIAALNPVLIYLAQPDVSKHFDWLAAQRSKPHYASEETQRFMTNRKRIEEMLLSRLPFPAYVIENPDLDWDKALDQMVQIAARHGVTA